MPYAVLTAIVFAAFAVVGASWRQTSRATPIGWIFARGGAPVAAGRPRRDGVYWHMAFGRRIAPAAADSWPGSGAWVFLPAFVLLARPRPAAVPDGRAAGPALASWWAGRRPSPEASATAEHRPRARAARGRRLPAGWTIRSASKVSASGRSPMVSFVAVGRRGVGRAHLARGALPPRPRNRAAAAEVGGGGGLRAGRCSQSAVAWRRLGSARGRGWVAMLLGLLAVAVGIGDRPPALPPLRHRRRDQPHAGLRCADGDAGRAPTSAACCCSSSR